MMISTPPFLNELVKLAYGWGAMGKVLSIAKKMKVPKAFRRRVDAAMGASVGAKGGIVGTYMGTLGGSQLKGPRILTPASGGGARALRQLANSVSAAAMVRSPYQSAALNGLKRLKLKGTENKALNAVVEGHELDEVVIGLKKRRKGLGMSPVTGGVGHQSPDVLFREHNRLVTLPKEVRVPVTGAVQKLRAMGDSDIIENGFKGNFRFGDTPRLSRHARKRMTESLERRHALGAPAVVPPPAPPKITTARQFKPAPIGMGKHLNAGTSGRFPTTSMAKTVSFPLQRRPSMPAGYRP